LAIAFNPVFEDGAGDNRGLDGETTSSGTAKSHQRRIFVLANETRANVVITKPRFQHRAPAHVFGRQ
jgi:hypothetical protein